MTERPILFSGEMIRAILDGRKTVTRREIKLPRARDSFVLVEHGAGWWPYQSDDGESHVCSDGIERPYNCPYGSPGDQLWVRESWWQAGDYVQSYPEDDEGVWSGSRRVVYSADGAPPNEPNRHYPNGLRKGSYSAADPHAVWRHRPSIHMPRWASRIQLEITAVRVERLQDISEDQAQAEGAVCELAEIDSVRLGAASTYRAGFQRLWQSINGPESWQANPWVWVVEFRRIDHQKEQCHD